MAFKGDFESVPLWDVLQTLNQNSKNGVLHLNCSDIKKSIYCSNSGITLLEPEVLKKRRFGDIVVAAGLVDREMLENVIDKADNSLKIGEALEKAGLVDQETIEHILKIQVEEEIFSLSEESTGEFVFHEEDSGLRELETEQLPFFRIEELALEAARRMDEWKLIHNHIPDLDTVFIPNTEHLNEKNDPAEQRVLKHVTGKKTVRNISDSLLASPFEVCKVMAALAKEGKIRPAEKHELLSLAQDLIDNNSIESAGVILKKLRPDLKNIILNEDDVKTLSNLFYKVGDILTATNILLEKVRQSKETSMIEDGIPFLKQAHSIAPEDTRILNELAKIYANLGDSEVRIQYLISLAKIHFTAGRYETGIQVCHEILDVDPDNGYVLKSIPDLLEGSNDKNAAFGFLEEIVNKLGKKADPELLVGIYRKMIRFDPSKKEIREKLKKTQKAMARGSKKPLYLAGFMVIIAGAALFWRTNDSGSGRRSDMDKVAYATFKFAKGDIQGARSAVLALMDEISNPDALSEARVLLSCIDRRNKQNDMLTSEIERKKYMDRLKTVYELSDAWNYGKAFIELKRLSADFDMLGFAETTRKEVESLACSMREEMDALRIDMREFVQPSVDKGLKSTLDRYKPLMSHEKAEFLESSVDCIRSLAKTDFFKGTITEELTREAGQTSIEAQELLRELDKIELRLSRIDNLGMLDKLLIEAEKAEREGRLEEALDFYSRLLEGYGDGAREGSQKETFLRKEKELQAFFDAIHNVDKKARSGDIEEAHSLACSLFDNPWDSIGNRYIKVPVFVTSAPTDAKIHYRNKVVGTTPCLLFLNGGRSLDIVLESEGFQRERHVLERTLGARQHFNLNRKVQYTVNLNGIVESAPLIQGSDIYAGSRNGAVFRIDAKTGCIIQRFDTESLSGISASLISAHGKIYFHTMEGMLWAVSPSTLEPEATAELSAGTHTAPVAAPNGIISACFDGTCVCRSPDLSSTLWTYQGTGKIVVDPVQEGGRLAAALTGKQLVCLNVENGLVLWSIETGAEAVSGLAVGQGLVVLTSKSGRVKGVEIGSGKIIWSTDMDTFIDHAPVVTGDRVIVAAGRDIAILRLHDGSTMERLSIGETITTAPASKDGLLCFTTEECNLHLCRTGSKKDIWVFHSPETFTCTPVLNNESVFAIDGKKRLLSIQR